MAVVDIAGFVADLKDHAAEHGFHVHDERHFVETYSMRQAFEVDLHPGQPAVVPWTSTSPWTWNPGRS